MRRAFSILVLTALCTLLTGPLLPLFVNYSGIGLSSRPVLVYTEFEHQFGDHVHPVLCGLTSRWDGDIAELRLYGVAYFGELNFSRPRTPVRPPPTWARLPIVEKEILAVAISTCRFGVPFRSFSRETWEIQSAPERLTPKWALRIPLPSRQSSTLIPLRPIWPGLLANIAIYAISWWMLLFGFGTIRRALRRRRGLCPACAYDLRATPAASPCPECGSRHSAITPPSSS